MTGVAIRLSGVSKKYRIFDSPRQRLKEALNPFGRTYHRDFWALKDIDLVVPKGQTVGIIGRNGSGKSTLLQIITSVLQPTSGTVEISGRVAALLELGAGFDPDFTGRQNVRQFGRLQGLKSAEIEARLPEIEAFADIGEFFERPVKAYSSGMFARLAFAAAINVDPDILILDEILAVGDARFQVRCYDRIRKLQDRGKTVLVVSHSLETIIDHCKSAILLDKGTLVANGEPKAVTDIYREILFDEVADRYAQIDVPQVDGPAARPSPSATADDLPPIVAEMLTDSAQGDRFPLRPGYNEKETIWGSGDAELVDYRLEVNGQIATSDRIECGAILRLYVAAVSRSWHDELHFGIALRRTDGLFVYGSNTVMRPKAFHRWRAGERLVFSGAFRLSLNSASYFFDLGLFRRFDGEALRLRTRRNSIHLSVASSPDFDGIVDVGLCE